MKWLLAALVIVVYVLHQDYWNWSDKTLVFGVLPKGLAYHGTYAFLAAFLMWLLVKFAWPEKLERSVPDIPLRPDEDAH